MALSTGQITDAFQSALNRPPTGQELAQYSGDNSLEGDPGKSTLVSRLGGGGPSSAPSSNFSSSNFTGVTNPVDTARQLIQVQQQANQPAVTALQGQIQPLEDRYKALIDSIKGQGSVTGNYAQQAASMDLGRRGLLPQSQEGQQSLSTSLLPVTQATSGAIAQTGLGEQQDINQINQAIAALQSGNPQQSVNNALSLYSTQQTLANNLAVGSLQNLFKEYGQLGGVVNTQTGQNVGGGGMGGGGLSLNTGNNTGATTTTPSVPSYFTPASLNYAGSASQTAANRSRPLSFLS